MFGSWWKVRTTKPTIEVDAGGRGGDVLYKGAEGTLRFPWEAESYGYEIPVPTAAAWEADTGLPLAARAETIALLGEAFLAQRCGGRGTWQLVEGRWSVIQIRP